MFDYDATVIERLREAGAVLVAKLAMVELAGGMGYNNPDASYTGPGRSPWNAAYWSGGSSSGSGAATAAGLVRLRHRLRDQRVDPDPGHVLRAVRAAAHLRPGVAPRRDGAVLDPRQARPDVPHRRRLRPGAGGDGGAGPEGPDHRRRRVRLHAGPARAPAAHRRRAQRDRAQPARGARPPSSARWTSLRTFADVADDVEFPDLPYGPAVGIIVDAEGAAAFRDLIESGNLRKLREKADRWGGYPMMMTLAADYIDAMRVRVPMRKALDELLGRYDALVTPTRTAVAPPIGYDFDKPPQPPPSPAPDSPAPPATIPAGNLAGLPALCVPNGFGQHGLPTSLQFLGRAFSEATLIDLGDRYQNATGWHLKRPPMDKLADAPARSAARAPRGLR